MCKRPRYGSTEQEVEKASQILKQVLRSDGIDVALVKKAIDPKKFKIDALQSNKILIAGKPLDTIRLDPQSKTPCDIKTL